MGLARTNVEGHRASVVSRLELQFCDSRARAPRVLLSSRLLGAPSGWLDGDPCDASSADPREASDRQESPLSCTHPVLQASFEIGHSGQGPTHPRPHSECFRGV